MTNSWKAGTAADSTPTSKKKEETADAEEEEDGEQADEDTKEKNAVAFAKRSVYIIKSRGPTKKPGAAARPPSSKSR